MQLDWVVDHSQNKLTLTLGDFTYVTFDGGQNIDKYCKGEHVKLIKQYPDKPDWSHGFEYNPPACEQDEWPEELEWIIARFPEVGERHFVTTYREKDGNVVDAGQIRGNGVNNLTDLIAVNRLGQPASVQEKWDWEEIATTDSLEQIPDTVNDPNLHKANAGISWYRHIETGVIERAGSSQNCPCHVFPQIYPPVQINPQDLENDIANYGGHRLDE